MKKTMLTLAVLMTIFVSCQTVTSPSATSNTVFEYRFFKVIISQPDSQGFTTITIIEKPTGKINSEWTLKEYKDDNPEVLRAFIGGSPEDYIKMQFNEKQFVVYHGVNYNEEWIGGDYNE